MATVVVAGANIIADAIVRQLAEGAYDVVEASDVTPEALEAAVRAAIAAGGRVDALVNAPDIHTSGTILDTDEDVWDHVVAVNLTAVFRACKAVLPSMIANGGGTIVNVGSSAGWGGHDRAAYAASKGGVFGFGAALAYDHFNDRVRVNTIAADETARPDDIANAVAFLLSADAEILSGSILDVGAFAYQAR